MQLNNKFLLPLDINNPYSRNLNLRGTYVHLHQNNIQHTELRYQFVREHEMKAIDQHSGFKQYLGYRICMLRARSPIETSRNRRLRLGQVQNYPRLWWKIFKKHLPIEVIIWNNFIVFSDIISCRSRGCEQKVFQWCILGNVESRTQSANFRLWAGYEKKQL